MDATGPIADPIAAAFQAHPREHFLPPRLRRRASYDGPLEIGGGQTSSQPRTVAAMLRLLDVRPGQHVLDVGSGSGWTAALLGDLVGPTGRVRGVELLGELVTFARGNLAHDVQPWVTVEPARPGVLGLPQHAPYDRVLVSAMAERLPSSLRAQLSDDGVMVVPVRGTMLRVTHDEISEHGHYSFVPLVTR
ncbi:protein-L-isoaspartate O-methyltransferase [Nocardioides sp. 616]|uniref:protein-L-isoaspartate O-methyltransferase family protein n=1 Tax=Nocardioides sp. 616 TaxID=2268090 RepID=UPI000CE2F756|nr:protein-L-isoaspartate O-methyltransferase [Nocardioides sp. 616]